MNVFCFRKKTYLDLQYSISHDLGISSKVIFIYLKNAKTKENCTNGQDSVTFFFETCICRCILCKKKSYVAVFSVQSLNRDNIRCKTAEPV